jgi:3-hydroxyacyl-[acyl-carrier-protein] dehydratase
MRQGSILFGPEVIQRLLPHRRPFLMVDIVEAYARSPRPTLRAARQISANEPVLEGYFPGQYRWPDVYVIEGLAQSCRLLHGIWTLQEEWAARGEDPDLVIASLKNLELGYRLHPGVRPEASARLTQALAVSRVRPVSAVEIELQGPVHAGQRLDYEVRTTELVDRIIRFDATAEVSGRAVARGVIRMDA